MTVPRLTVPTLAASLVVLALAAPGASTASTIDLRHHPAFEIVGATPGSSAGAGVAAAGDVDGDGVGDVIVGAPVENASGRQTAGSAYVVFGRRRTAAAIRRAPRMRIVATAPAQGFRIIGPSAFAQVGGAVTSVGDVNGDGLSDLAISARVGATVPLPITPIPAGAPIPTTSQGAVFVVFGKRDGAPVDLAHLAPSQGLEILGADPAGGTVGFGFSGVAGGRDVDGDGVPDLVASDGPSVDPDGKTGADQHSYTYVMSGAALRGGTVLHADALGAAGYRLRGWALGRPSLAADMNGDGRAEVVVNAAVGAGIRPGVARVVFGRPEGGGDVDTAALAPDAGFTVQDGRPADANGIIDAAGGGDVNGDGRGDLVITGAVGLPGHRFASTASVVLGAPSGAPVSLAAPGARVLTIRAPAQAMERVDLPDGTHAYLYTNPHSPRSENLVSAAIVGDRDGDGLADLVTGVWSAPGNVDTQTGGAVLVPGRRAAGTVSLHGRGTLTIRGAYAGDKLGDHVAGAGDFDGDGRADVLVAADDATREGRTRAGAVWVLSGVAP